MTGVKYPLVLAGQPPVQLVVGTLTGVLGFLILPGLVAQAILALAAVFRRPPVLREYFADALAYHYPEGVFAAHLGIIFAAVVSVVLLRYLHGTQIKWLASMQPGTRWRYLIACLLLAAVVVNAVLWVGPEARNMPWQALQSDWYAYVPIIVICSPLQAAAEEIFFRGYLQQTLGSMFGNSWAGVVGASLTFAVFHGVQNPALFAHRLGFGLIAGMLVVTTGGLEASIATHIVNNLMAYGYALFTGGVAATAAVRSITWTSAVSALVGFGLTAVLAYVLAKRMNLATTIPAGTTSD